MSFSHEDVQRLLQLLDSSHFDELHLEAEGIKLTLRRGGAIANPAAVAPLSAPVASASAPKPPEVLPPVKSSVPAPAAIAAALPAGADTSLLDIRAPMLGTYYGAPKPGAAPFVTVGGRVSADSAVAIIEVMKLMNSIAAGVDGVVVEVLARDGDLVEFDQVLLRVRPA
jgi:acetyl-CoA carboxylase biotin carboxyl carrier protein